MKAELQSQAGKKKQTYSDEYVQIQWKRFIMATGQSSDLSQQDRIKYWVEKYK